MKFFASIIGLVCAFSMTASAADDAQPIRMITDNWCPYTCPEDNTDKGLMVEVVEAAYAAMEIDTSYTVTAWNRAVKNVERSAYDVLVGATVDDIDALLVYPDYYIVDETVYAVRAASGLKIRSAEDLAGHRLGKIDGYVYDDPRWADAIANHNDTIDLPGSDGELRLLELLVNKRIDIAIVNLQVATYFLKKNNQYDLVRLERPGIFSRVFIGFPETPLGKEHCDLFKAGLKKIQNSGKFAAIYRKYGVEVPAEFQSN